MSNNYFQFKKFRISQQHASMKVTTDACLFGAWVADKIKKEKCDLVLDIGSGTGLLSLMIAQENTCHVDAVEIEKGAAEEANENVLNSPWKNSIRIIHSDILSLQPCKYDIIVSNPPFYENDLQAPSDNKNIAHHSTGLKLEELLDVVSKNLDGAYYLLLPHKRKMETLSLLEGLVLHVEELINVSHSEKHKPSRIMIRGRKGKTGRKEIYEERDLFIRKQDGNYSAEFSSLLKPYYLYL